MATALKAPPDRHWFACRDDVVRLFGPIEDQSIADLLALTPTIAELEQAHTWLEGQYDSRGGRMQTPRVAAILEILDTDDREPQYLQ